MSFLDDIGNAISDGVSDIANLAGDAIQGAGDLIGMAGDAVGAAGGLLGAAFNGIGDLLGAAGGVLGGVFPPLGIAMSLGSMLAKGLGGVVQEGTKMLQEAAQLPKFAAHEFNDMIHQVTGQLTGGGQTNPACDAAVNGKWGDHISSILDGIKNDFVDNCSGEKNHKKSWIDVLVDGLKTAVQGAFDKMQASESKVTGNDSDSPTVLLDFQRDAKFFDLVMTTATQTIKDSLDAAKNMAQAA